jgi:glutamine amidotransferase
MITIIDYGNTNAGEIAETLNKLSAECMVTGSEKGILAADKIILADCNDITSSIRKLHLLNLFSALRIVKKPVLGIGTGMHLMTRVYTKFNAACLGCFPVDCESRTDIPQSEFEEHQINIIVETELLKGIKSDDRFLSYTNCVIPVNDFTTSTMDVNSGISASIEKENLYGLQFNPEKSGEAGLKIFKNFLAM